MEGLLCSRAAQTFMTFVVALIEGYSTGIYGPTLPQLICLFDTDVKTISSLFFVFGLMNAVGVVFGCVLQGRLNPFLLLSMTVAAQVVTVLIFPYTFDVILAIVVAGISATAVGVSFHCRLYIASQLWPTNAFAIHLSIAGFAMGPVIASAIAAPFLNHGANVTKSLNNNIVCSHLEDVSSVKYPFIILGCIGIPFMFINMGCFVKNRDSEHFSVGFHTRRGFSMNIQKGTGRLYIASQLWPTNAFAIHLSIAGFAMGPVIASAIAAPFLNHGANVTKSLNNNIVCSHLEDVSSVKYPFIILGCIGIPFMFINMGCFVKNRDSEHFSVGFHTRRGFSMNIQKGTVAFITFFFLHCIPVGGLFIVYGDLLTTFGVNGPLHIGADDMALLTAVFWASFVIGRLIMTCLTGCVKQMYIAIICYFFMFLALGLLLLLGSEDVIFLGIGTSLFGLFAGPFSALAFSYVREHIALSNVMIILGGFGEYTGAMLAPYVGGVVMGQYGAGAFFYVILGLVCIQLIFFIGIFTTGKYCLENQTEETSYDLLES